jgi:hypothetical protein
VALVGPVSSSSGLSIGLSGSVILANPDEVGATFPGLPGTDVDFFISGAIGFGEGSVTVLGGEVVASGSIIVEKNVEAILGLSGSLTRLTNGKSFIEAGANVTVTSASNGAITIAATGGGSTNAAGSDTQIQYNNGGTDFGGIADLTWDDTNVRIGNTSDTTQLQFRNANSYIYSSIDGFLDIQATSVVIVSASNTTIVQDLPDWSKDMPAAGIGGGMSLKNIGSGAGMTAGAVYYLSGNGDWSAASAAHVESGSQNFMVIAGGVADELDMWASGIAVISSSQVDGEIAGIPFLSGSVIYLSKNIAGNVTFTAPTGSGEVVKILGHCIGINGQTILTWFNPERGWIELS